MTQPSDEAGAVSGDSGDLDRGWRPAGVTVAAWLIIAPAAALGIMMAVATIGFGVFAFFGGPGGFSVMFLLLALVQLVISLIIPTLLVLLGIGLLRMRPWSRPTAFVAMAVFGLLAVGPFAFGRGSPLWTVSAGVALPLAVVVLLLLPSSADAFAEAREREA